MNARHDAFAEQVRYLDSLGPRLTGSAAHGALVEKVAEQLTGLGLTVHRDPHRFTRWNAPRDSTHLNLTVGNRAIRISSAYPCSGTTGPDGITGPLHLVTGGLRKTGPPRKALSRSPRFNTTRSPTTCASMSGKDPQPDPNSTTQCCQPR